MQPPYPAADAKRARSGWPIRVWPPPHANFRICLHEALATTLPSTHPANVDHVRMRRSFDIAQACGDVVMFATAPTRGATFYWLPGRHMVSSLAWFAGRAAAMSPRETEWRRISHSLARRVGSRERTIARMSWSKS